MNDYEKIKEALGKPDVSRTDHPVFGNLSWWVNRTAEDLDKISSISADHLMSRRSRTSDFINIAYIEKPEAMKVIRDVTDQQLEDGNWVTTAIPAPSSLGPLCPNNTCQWEDFGPPTLPGMFPITMQFQTCAKCKWGRACYPKGYDPSTGKHRDSITMTGSQHEGVLIVASSLPQNPPGRPNPCHFCHTTIDLDKNSVRLVEGGAHAVCVPCGLAYHPDVIAGRDPDTGQPLTLREVALRPDTACRNDYRVAEDQN